MAYADDILDYLWSQLPGGATNSQIAGKLGIRSQQTVYLLTQDLVRRGLVQGERLGREWVFFALEAPHGERENAPRWMGAGMPARPAAGPVAFEALARSALSRRYHALLSPGTVPGVHRRFDFVSPDGQVVGDAMYFELGYREAGPAARFSVIAEHVWLLEKTRAPITFLVFGNDRNVPELWLERHGSLLAGVAFYFLTGDGRLELLTQPEPLAE